MSGTNWHLAVIDMQHVFSEGPWGAPRFAEILAPTAALVAAAPSVTFTRFVAPARPEGAWVDYYREWPFALQPPDAPLFDVVEGIGFAPGADVLTATTFSKWGAELAARVADRPLVLSGVSTDCCVVSTALAAADAGVPVRVVTDACAGADDTTHAQALALMGLYAPLITLVTVADLVGGARPRPGWGMTQSAGESEGTVVAPILKVADGSATARWYERCLGFTVEFEHSFGPGTPLYQGLRRDRARIHLSEHAGDASPDTLLYVHVDDVDAAAAACGITHLHDNPWGRDFEVSDPDGNRLRVGSPNRD